jgi:hypothetical protein
VTPDRQERRSPLPAALAALGALVSLLGLLDGWGPGALWVGPVLCGAALCLSPRGRRAWPGFLLALSLAYATAGLVRPELRADSVSYYAYLRSAAFDHDLDFTNEWQEWGLAPAPRTDTGLLANQHSVGPAIVWSPFFLLAHLWVVLTGHGAADGFSRAYVRSAAAGTLAVGLGGAWLLARTLAARFGAGTGVLAVATAVLASPVVYYLFVVPAMAHGLAFGVAAAAVWAFARLEAQPSLRGWIVFGALAGLLVLIRWQSAVYALFPVPLLLSQWRRGRLQPAWVAAAAAVACVIVVPQLLAWKVLYGSFLTIPQGRGFLALWPERGLDVLFHADHGLFTWTPVLLVGAIGLACGLFTWPRLAAGGLAVFAATAFVNGSVLRWAGDDAFGARRFDLVVPFLAFGLAVVVRWLARRPLAACALVLLPFAAWNLGYVTLVRRGLADPPGPGRVAQGQAVLLGRVASSLLGAVAGERGRAFGYKAFVGEYLYYNIDLGGTIGIVDPDERLLVSGWSSPRRNADPVFRWGFFPRSCVELPLEAPFALRMAVTARVPKRLGPQEVGVSLNGAPLGRLGLDEDWREHVLELPEARLHPGVNTLCLEYSAHLPGDPEGLVAAAVSRIQLP